jgi:hypothetical protein
MSFFSQSIRDAQLWLLNGFLQFLQYNLHLNNDKMINYNYFVELILDFVNCLTNNSPANRQRRACSAGEVQAKSVL